MTFASEDMIIYFIELAFDFDFDLESGSGTFTMIILKINKCNA